MSKSEKPVPAAPAVETKTESYASVYDFLANFQPSRKDAQAQVTLRCKSARVITVDGKNGKTYRLAMSGLAASLAGTPVPLFVTAQVGFSKETRRLGFPRTRDGDGNQLPFTCNLWAGDPAKDGVPLLHGLPAGSLEDVFAAAVSQGEEKLQAMGLRHQKQFQTDEKPREILGLDLSKIPANGVPELTVLARAQGENVVFDTEPGRDNGHRWSLGDMPNFLRWKRPGEQRSEGFPSSRAERNILDGLIAQAKEMAKCGDLRFIRKGGYRDQRARNDDVFVDTEGPAETQVETPVEGSIETTL